MIKAKTTDQSRKPTMSSIQIRVTQEQFETHILPYLSTAQRGYTSKTPLRQIFNLMLYRLHTGCQWNELPVPKHGRNRKKETELASGVSPLSQVEQRRELRASVARQYHDD
jgi:hypothetical protein